MKSKKDYKILGLIGARSGSKGVPNKNIRLFDGKPLMGLIIEKAKKLNTKKYVLKAQIHAGGRGKAGGVKLISNGLVWLYEKTNSYFFKLYLNSKLYFWDEYSWLFENDSVLLKL